MSNLASVYLWQGKLAEGERLEQKSLAVFEKVLGPESLRVAHSLDALATFYKSEGRHAEAEPLAKRSAAIREKQVGPESAEYAASLNTLAELYRLEGKYGDAEPLYRRSLAIAKKARGPEDGTVAIYAGSLAVTCTEQGRFAEAEALYKLALAIQEKVQPPDSPLLAVPADFDDGVLTAYEASTLDLQGTELVVLSACETGLGEVTAGEGVFELRRALQVAGAEAVLMSKWSLPDRETQELMTLPYQKWLAGTEKHEALREAQLAMRKRVQERYGKDLPQYWGAFVMVGR